ncbi:hypothetical protein [Sorangium sp. So ce1099]|uniref:hypothetical protein n=1 Tax=Sorangium sp. So ce1099 TaxID=3133331 RepID=UPI003F616006
MRWTPVSLCLSVLALAAATGGCGHRPSSSSAAEADALTGLWSYREGPEPPPGPIDHCSVGNHLKLRQTGEALTGEEAICAGPCYPGFTLQGTIKGRRVHLEGTTAPVDQSSEKTVHRVYELSWNPDTQHLTGTRDGRPFWAARFMPDESRRPCIQ